MWKILEGFILLTLSSIPYVKNLVASGFNDDEELNEVSVFMRRCDAVASHTMLPSAARSIIYYCAKRC